MTRQENRSVVEQFWATMNTNDFGAAGAWLHDSFVLDWPQSGERIRGRENFIAVNEHYPAAGRWRFSVQRLIADEQEVVTEVLVTDGVTTAQAITFSEVRDGKIAHQTEYWPDPFQAAAWRAEWVERMA
jgi:limonene-1,2-epoxide hydrolase